MSHSESQTSILDPCRFPPELLDHIFRHLAFNDLKSAILVCRHWRDRIVASPSLMGKVTLRFPANRALDRRHPGVRYLLARNAIFEGCSVVSVDPWWTNWGPKLVRITLQKVKIDLPTLMAMLRQATNLKELRIIDSAVTECEDFGSVVRLNSLESLTNRGSPALLNVLKQSCTRLRTIFITNRNNSEEADLLELVRTVQSTLKVLNTELTETVLEAISEMDQLKLTEAGLLHSRDVTLAVEFCRLQPNLTTLIFFGIEITGSTLLEIGQLLPNLTRLTVCFVGMDYEPLSLEFLRTMPKLELLHLIGDSRTLRYKQLGLINPSWCRSLKTIQLRYIAVQSDETWQFLACSHQMQTLSLTSCLIQNWPQFAQALGLMPSLKRLTMDSNKIPETWSLNPTRFTNSSIEFLRLKSIRGPKNLLDSLIYSLPKLKELQLDGIWTLDDASVQHLSHRFAKLRKLAIQSCPITDESVRHFYKNPGKLEKIELRFIKGLSEQEVQRLKEKIGTVIFVQKPTFKFKITTKELACFGITMALALSYDYMYS